MKAQLNVTSHGRPFDFAMDLDPGFQSDADCMAMFNAGNSPEPELVCVLSKVLQEGDIAVDVGANIGFFSLLMSHYVGPAGEVISIEPGVNNISKFQANMALNNVSNVRLVPQPIWGEEGNLQFFESIDSGGNSVWDHSRGSTRRLLSATTLDVLVGDKAPKMVKIDIEGSEFQALYGATQLLKRHPPFIVIELNREALGHTGETPQSLCEFMYGHGYEAFMIHQTGDLPALVPRQCKVVPYRYNANMLFSTLADVGNAWSEICW